MAIWNRNKVPPANLNAGQQYNAEDWTSEQTFNVANNNAFYAVDYAEALADAPDNTEAGNIGTPTVSLIDNVKTIDGTPKTFKKFKFANLKGEKGDAGINDANVVQEFGTSTEDAISQKVITDKFDELDEQLNAVPVSGTSKALTKSLSNTSAGITQALTVKGLTATQLVQNGNFANTSIWTAVSTTLSASNNIGSFTADAQSDEIFQPFTLTATHKVYIQVNLKSVIATATDVEFQLYRATAPNTAIASYFITVSDTWQKYEVIATVATTDTYNYRIIDRRTSDWQTIYAKNCYCINLTATFGAGLEPDLATCQTLFPSYFDGTKSVDKGEVSVVGKNLFDKTKINANKYVKPDGTIGVATDYSVTDYIIINPSTAYVKNSAPAQYTAFYDLNKLCLSVVSGNTFTSPVNAYYVRTTFYNTDINILQIEVGSTATTYAPYNSTRARYPKLQSVPAITDTFDVLGGVHKQNIQSVATTSGTAINTTNYPLAKNAVGFVIALTAGGTQTGTVGTDSASGDGTLYYQLATPVLSYYPPKSIPLEVNSSIIHQSIMSDIVFYSTGISISDTDYPINSLQEVYKVDTETGVETPIDIATCTVASGGLSFTSTALTDGDLVWFRYEHTLDSATPTTEYTYTTSLSGGLTTIQQDVKNTNDNLQKQIDELRAIIASMTV